MTSPLNNLTDTWNNGATVFTGLKYNITETASASASLYMDFQVGGASVLKLMKTTPAGGTGLFIGAKTPDSQKIIITPKDGTTGSASFTAGAPYYFDGPLIPGFLSAIVDGAQITAEATDVIAIRHSSTATSLRVYNTTDLTNTNYERGVFDWTTNANILTIGVQALGTGSMREVLFLSKSGSSNSYQFQVGGTNAFGIRNALNCIQVYGSWPITWGSSETNSSFDTGISRSAAGVVAFGNGGGGDSSATIVAKTKAGAFAAGDIPTGTWALCRDTSGATTKLIYNNAGTLMSVALT